MLANEIVMPCNRFVWKLLHLKADSSVKISGVLSRAQGMLIQNTP